MVQFDTQDPYEVLHHFAPLQEIPALTRETYVPRAATPLLDALGRGINELEHSLAVIPEAVRPSKVVFVVITDGQENSSREFRKEQIVKMIREKQEKDGWQFVFLSADLEAIEDAMGYGFHAASSMAFDKTESGVGDAFASLSARLADYRGARASEVAFHEEDRQRQEGERRRRR
ncbi:MAG: hypothetical protein D6736_00365 [Nitrospinota bacterium]|nr:MAG: hypothetical protein D6736_00365 [Nitrospinota bacterium]